jgi:hypothetical protein
VNCSERDFWSLSRQLAYRHVVKIPIFVVRELLPVSIVFGCRSWPQDGDTFSIDQLATILVANLQR